SKADTDEMKISPKSEVRGPRSKTAGRPPVFARLLLTSCFLLPAILLGAAEREEIRRGPLKISADETVSQERGKRIEAAGHGNVRGVVEFASEQKTNP